MHTLGSLTAGLIRLPLTPEHAARPVTGVFDDSRAVQPGGVFVAVRGQASDGRRFIPDALARGAAAIIGEELQPADGKAAIISVDDARLTLALLAARWFRVDPASLENFKLIGITGTNGKSTTTYMTAAILRAAGIRTAMLGTVQYDLCHRSVKAGMTTPGPIELCSYLRESIDAGAQAAVMEVSSHALDQRRVDGLLFAAAGFTNLTQDHLDYHGTMEAYGAAKARLFQMLGPQGTAVVNADDAAHLQMLANCRSRVLRYSIEHAAELTARITRDTIRGTLYRMRLGGNDVVLENALVGKHNVYNALAAAGLALAVGASASQVEAGLASVRNIPGRLQRVLATPGVEVFVDYAHTDDALRNVLRVLRPLTKGSLIAVFGCGGDRDRTKRPKMAKAAAEFADAVIVTSDNPRSEDPRAIVDDIVAGFDEGMRRRVCVEPDRRRAIYAALAGAREGDTVLIAGKGHEDYQIIGTQRVHFDDVEVAIAAGAQLARETVAAR